MRARSAAPRQRGAPPGLASCAGALQILLSAVQALLWGRPSKDASRVRGVDPRVISSVRASTWPVLAKLALVFFWAACWAGPTVRVLYTTRSMSNPDI